MDWELTISCGVVVVAMLLLYFVAARLGRTRSDRWLASLIADAKAGRLQETRLENPNTGVISVAEDGFAVRRGGKRLQDVKWDAVEEIRAYKRDIFVYDLICWGFRCSHGDYVVEVHEEMLGFKKLQDVIGARFGVRHEDWYCDVAFPAFVTNMTVLWSR